MKHLFRIKPATDRVGYWLQTRPAYWPIWRTVNKLSPWSEQACEMYARLLMSQFAKKVRIVK